MGDQPGCRGRSQAEDLLAGLAAAAAQVPGVPAGLFGHSQAVRSVRNTVRALPEVAWVWGISSDVTAELWARLVLVGAYDPLPAVRSLSVPLLAAFGGGDHRMTPAGAEGAAGRTRRSVGRIGW
ncbi:hypothetical protein ACFWEJ_21855 [Promicromonospora sp. NPDC060204]|uniref:hypothetical protein n=1 Tax=Promicromonospora sp. NPDC060204 TaxID=3347071 RepID=UPI00365B20FA